MTWQIRDGDPQGLVLGPVLVTWYKFQRLNCFLFGRMTKQKVVGQNALGEERMIFCFNKSTSIYISRQHFEERLSNTVTMYDCTILHYIKLLNTYKLMHGELQCGCVTAHRLLLFCYLTIPKFSNTLFERVCIRLT